MSAPERIGRPDDPAVPEERLKRQTHVAVTGGGPAWRRYQDVVVGQHSLAATLYFEFCMLLGPVPGALGLFLRKLFWPRLFGACGRGTQFGANIVLRHPHRIHLGKNVVVSHGCSFDARSPEVDAAIVIGADTVLAEGVMLQTKDGRIRIGQHVGLGPLSIRISTADCFIEIGDGSILGPRCKVFGGERHGDGVGRGRTRYALRLVKQRLHQAAFRDGVLAAYDHRCAISNLPDDHLLDAAHIMADTHELLGQPVLANGIALSKIHHAAFDNRLIGIDPDGRVHVSKRLLALHDGPLLEQSLKAIEGAMIRLPRTSDHRPDRDRLAARFEQFKRVA